MNDRIKRKTKRKTSLGRKEWKWKRKEEKWKIGKKGMIAQWGKRWIGYCDQILRTVEMS